MMVTGARATIPLAATIAIVMAPALSSFAAIGLTPVLPQMTRVFVGQTQLVTLVLTLPLLAAAMATASLGVFGDRFPRRAIFIAAAGLYAVSAPIPFLLDSLPLILLARFLTGLAIGGMVAPSLGLIGDLFTDGRRAVLLSAQNIVAAVMTIGGTALNGFSGQFGWHYAFLIYLIGVPVFFLALFIPKSGPAAKASERPVEAVKAPFPWRSTAIIYVLSMVGILLIIPASYELGYLFTERGVGTSVMIGNMTAVISVGGAAGATLLPVLRRWTPFFAIAFCLMLSSLGQGLVVLAGTAIAPLVLGVLLFGSAQGLFMAFMALWLLGRIDWSVRGRATGLFRTLLYICGFLGPQVARLASKALGSSQSTYLTFSAMTMALAVLLITVQAARSRGGEIPAKA